MEPEAHRCFLTVRDVTDVRGVKAAGGTSFHVGGNRVRSECRDDATFRFWLEGVSSTGSDDVCV